MKKTILGLITATAVIFAIGMAGAQNFVKGEAKGADAPGAMLIGAGNQALELSGLNIDAVNQAFGNVNAVNLSEISPKVFDQPWMKKDGLDTFLTPSQNDFRNNKDGENY